MLVKSLYFMCLFLAHCTFILADSMIQYTVLTVEMLKPEAVVAVLVDGAYYPMQRNAALPMMYTASAPKGQTSYKYTIKNPEDPTAITTETFDRPAEYLTDTKSFNDVFGQNWHKVDDMNPLPQLYEFDKEKYSPMGGNHDPAASNLYEDGTIATVHFSAPEEDILKLHTYKMSKLVKLKGDLTYINYNTIQQFKDVTFKVSGHSSRFWSKIPYKVKIDHEEYPDGLYRRWNFKLRPESTDPTMMREKLYNDILKSTGVVAARGNYVRFYINNEPIGLYLLVDDPQATTFIKETLYGGNHTKIGSVIKGDAADGPSAANLNYLGENIDLYVKEMYEVKKEAPEGHTPALEELVAFTRFINEYHPAEVPNDERVVKIWEEHLDITSFIRQLAVEWITGNWDAHQYSGNNYLLHRHSEYDKYLIIPVDFDYTFGNGIEEDQLKLLTGSPMQMTEGRIIHSYLFEKIRQTPYLQKVYEETIQDIGTQLTTPDILNARIDSIIKLIESSVKWDRSLRGQTVGTMSAQTINDFHASFDKGTPNRADQLIGLKEWIRIKHAAVKNLFGASQQ